MSSQLTVLARQYFLFSSGMQGPAWNYLKCTGAEGGNVLMLRGCRVLQRACRQVTSKILINGSKGYNR